MQAFTLETLARVPAFAAAVRELEAGRLAERQAQIDELAAFRAEWHAEVMQLAECAQTARRAADELRAQVLELQTEADRANSAALWRTTRATERDRALECAILATADPGLAQFRAWAARAANLAAVATYELGAAALNARQAREVSRLCAEANARADQMRREAIAADDVSLELDAMAAGILQALDRLGGSAAARLPRDWRNPLV